MKNIFVRLFVIAMIFPSLVYAQVPIVPASTMQRAVSGVMQSKFTQRGFASNDPRWGATLESAGASIVGAAAAAAAITAAGITAPAWVTVGATVALATLFAAGINLAIDGIKWVFNSDGSVSSTVNVPTPSLPAGKCYSAGVNALGCYGSISDAVAAQVSPPGVVSGSDQYGAYTWTTYYVLGTVPGLQYYNVQRCRIQCVYDFGLDSGRLVPDDHRASVYVGIRDGSPRAISYVDPPTVTSVTQSPGQAVAALDVNDKAKPVNPAILAAIADQAWKQAAAKPGYSGFPYDAANPITQADASAWQAAHPAISPTIGDLVAPQPLPSSGASANPFTLPNSAATPAVDPSTTPPVTTPPSGIDWAIPATSGSIPKQVAAITYTPTVFASPTGCPAPVSFSMFDKQYAIAYQPACDLMMTVAPIFLAIGAAGAALIFASALKS